MRNKTVYEHKAKTVDYFVALINYSNFTKLLNSVDKPYQPVLKWLIDKEPFLQDDNFSLPSIKELSQQLALDTAKVSKYLKMMYEEILELNYNQPYLFKKDGQILCAISFDYIGARAYFNIGVDVIPRIGDRFNFSFIKPKLGGWGFHVNKVYHDLDNNGHSIMIGVTWQHQNAYLNLLKEKAYLHRDISFWEYVETDMEDKLKEDLLRRYKSL